jgi:hypothetical protein
MPKGLYVIRNFVIEFFTTNYELFLASLPNWLHNNMYKLVLVVRQRWQILVDQNFVSNRYRAKICVILGKMVGKPIPFIAFSEKYLKLLNASNATCFHG